jgi:hypothetical protein
MAGYPPPRRRGATSVLNRAFAAGAGLVLGTVALTGVFIAKIANSYAATHSGGTPTNGRTDDSGGVGGGGVGGGQVSVPQQNQAPVGGSNGS